jgi:hypothetical protein
MFGRKMWGISITARNIFKIIVENTKFVYDTVENTRFVYDTVENTRFNLSMIQWKMQDLNCL